MGEQGGAQWAQGTLTGREASTLRWLMDEDAAAAAPHLHPAPGRQGIHRRAGRSSGSHRHARTAAEPLVGAAGRRLGDAATVSAQATPTGRHTEQARGEQGKLAPGTGSALTGAAPAARAGPS